MAVRKRVNLAADCCGGGLIWISFVFRTRGFQELTIQRYWSGLPVKGEYCLATMYRH